MPYRYMVHKRFEVRLERRNPMLPPDVGILNFIIQTVIQLGLCFTIAFLPGLWIAYSHQLPDATTRLIATVLGSYTIAYCADILGYVFRFPDWVAIAILLGASASSVAVGVRNRRKFPISQLVA